MYKAYVFIDESGDPGFDLEKGASPNFVLCCVIFHDPLEIEKVSLKMKEIRKQLKKSDKYEFKFNKMAKREKVILLTALRNYDYSFRAICVKKDNLRNLGIKTKKSKFYSYFINLLLGGGSINIKNAKIIIDGGGDKVFKREMIGYIRKNLNKNNRKIVGGIKIKDSKSSMPIQLADLIAGSVNRYFSKKSDAKIYLNIIKKRKDSIREYK